MNKAIQELNRYRKLAEELRHLREEVKQQSYALAKWGRMQNTLLAVLKEKGIITKAEIMEQLYRHLRDSGQLERSWPLQGPGTTSPQDSSNQEVENDE